jgi:uncharacterized protein (TIGR02466 family)
MQLEKWFATPIWYDISIFNYDAVASYCLEIAKNHPDRILSNNGGWQSTDLNLDDLIALKPIKEIINQKIFELSKNIGPNVELKLDNCWLNINYKGNSNNTHVHPLCLFSGVIYISVPENSGQITFYADSASKHYPPIINDKSDLFFQSVNYAPENGKILLFPAWLSHSVSENMSDEPRISIAFNISQKQNV